MRATGDLTGQAATSVSQRYVVGPQVDIGLPFGLGIEADALYRREGYQGGPVLYTGDFTERANSWEFPMLLKYTLPVPLLKPFLKVGYAPRVIDGTIHYYTNNTTSGTDYPASHGIGIGGGMQFGIGRLWLAPAVRYTDWNNAPVLVYFGNGPTSLSNQNQVDVLLGISWKLR